MTNKQNAIDIINEVVLDYIEYETTHGDSCEAYSFLVGESWDKYSTSRLMDGFKEWKRDVTVDCLSDYSYKEHWEVLSISPKWKNINLDSLVDIALESFTMESGSIYGSFCGGIVLESFAVGEVEVFLEDIELPEGINLKDIENDCECYISGTSYGYGATDSVWFAVLHVPTFNELIEQHFERSIDDI